MKKKRISHDTEMSFLDHLDEMRYRLVICISAIFLTTAFVGLPMSQRFVTLLTRPLRTANLITRDTPLEITVHPDGHTRINYEKLQRLRSETSRFRIDFVLEGDDGTSSTFSFGPDLRQDLYYFSPFDPFFVTLKAAALLGILLAVPIWLYQLWAFISPAFTPAEVKWVRRVFMAGVLLFPIGVSFAYLMLRFAFEMFFRTFSIPGLEARLNVTNYMSFVLTFMLLFGCVFETPLIVILLVRMGVVRTRWLRDTRQYAILIIVILSACLTPADPFTMMAMAIPLYILYESSIWISIALERRIEEESAKEEEKREEEEEEEDETQT